jgi:hypothetical protein
MATTEVEAKDQATTPKEEQPVVKINKGADASQEAEAQEKSTKNHNKEAKMADKKKQDIKKSNHDKSAVAKDIKAAEKTKSKETGLAPGVTLLPQNEDQADLRTVANGVEVSYVSVPVDDDAGQVINDVDGFKNLKDFIQENQSKKDEELNDPDLLESGTKLASEFDNKVGLQEAITLGVMNKYRLMWGMSLIILQISLKQKDGSASWMQYYQAHFTKSSLSSAEKYMKLAKISNIIRWAFLGLERLESIFTVIKDTEYMRESDPIAAFFCDANIAIDFKEEDLEKWRNTIDEAVTNKKIVKHFERKNENLSEEKKVEDTIDRSLIHDLISNGKKCNPGLINNLFLYKKGGADPNVLLEDLLETGADKLSDNFLGTLTATKTIEGFPKLISELRSKVTFLSNNTALIKEITPQHMEDLQTQVDALKDLVNAHQSTE